jgi:hypothetical protein
MCDTATETEGRVGHHTQPAEREQQTILHTDCIRLLRLYINLLPFIYEVSGHRQRRRFIASRYVGLVVMVSAFALIVRNATFASFAQNGTRPQRMMASSRSPVSLSSLTTGCILCGATLKDGARYESSNTSVLCRLFHRARCNAGERVDDTPQIGQ